MNNKRGEWYARDWVIAMLFFSGVMALMYLTSTDLLVTYDRVDLVDPGFSARYDRFQNSTASIQRMFDSTAGPEGLNPVSFGELVLQSSFTVITLVFGSIAVFNSQIANIAGDLGIPTAVSVIIGPLILGVVVVSLIFIIITSTSRNKI